MGQTLFLVNRSSQCNEVQQIRPQIVNEFKGWGYKVSKNEKDISVAEVLVLTEQELVKRRFPEGIAIVITDEEFLKDKYAHYSADQIFGLGIEVKAILISGKITKFYLSNTLGFQFSPMSLLLSTRKVNYQIELVSYLVNLLDITGGPNE